MSAGRVLGHYLVVRELGRGGMGIVYRARDTRLDRDVALKVIPESVASDPVRLARLRREAKLLASMNHPNIATIYGLEEIGDGRQAIIMELVEGETLDARLRREPMAWDVALTVCDQLALAVGQAHECGIIHRDLKPGNTILSPSGVVKVLDFGLASRTERGVPDDESLLFAGTPGYMSPEQARGEPVDRRTDVFAFGCILFECLTRRPAFHRTVPGARITGTPEPGPDWSAWPPDIPESVRDLAQRCLEPDHEHRWSDLRSAREVLRSARGLAVPSAPAILGLTQPTTTFIGRSREVADVELALRRVSLLTLTGPGGCGKTRLAQEVARRVVPGFPNGAAFVDLAPIPDGARVPLEVATTLGVRGRHGTSLTETLAAYLQEKRFLLVLDNCEHVLGACSDLAARLLSACSGLRILATSRESLATPGEQEFPLSPLGLMPEGLGVASSEAVQLFVERAKLVQPGFEITEENAPAVAGICRQVDGIPLGIELAAARVKTLAPEQIWAKLQTSLRLLAAPASGSSRHQGLEAAIAWSHGQLSERQRMMFRALSVFSGGWTLEAAEAILGTAPDSFDTLEDLTQLVNKSLVTVDHPTPSEVRYRMLETIRQFATEELRRAGEEEATRARHVNHYLETVEAAMPHLVGPEPFGWFARLEADRENFLAAARYCEGMSDGVEKAFRILGGLDLFWTRRGHFGLGHTALERAFAMPGADTKSVHRASALCTAGFIANVRGDPRSVTFLEESLALSRALDHKPIAARALSSLGVCAIGRGDHSVAEAFLRESLELSREIDDTRGVAIALGNLGALAFGTMDYERARGLFQEAVETFRIVGEISGAVTYLGGISRTSLFLGDVETARDALVQSASMIEKLGDKRNGATALLTAGLLAVRMKDHRTGARLLAAGEALRATFAATGALLAPADKALRDEAVAEIRKALGEAGFDQAWAEGHALDFQRALRAVSEFASSPPAARTKGVLREASN